MLLVNEKFPVQLYKTYRVSFLEPTLFRGSRSQEKISVDWVFFASADESLCYKSPGKSHGYALSPDIEARIADIQEVQNA